MNSSINYSMSSNPYSPQQLGQLLGGRKTYRCRGKKAQRGGKSRRVAQRSRRGGGAERILRIA